jgi:outer membrane scaffolding protein for murein synthesis (MipA/OmpV family)
LLACCAYHAVSAAENLPLWEVGAGPGVVAFPAYKGSDTYRSYAAPLPYFVYRGEIFQANRDGLRANFWQSGDWSAGFSAGGSLPVRSSGTLREGMPDLPPNIELGTALEYEAYSARSGDKITFLLPIRQVLAVEKGGVHRVGVLASPTLRNSGKLNLGGQTYDWGVSLAANFANRAYNSYYYDVSPAYALPSRPVYNASGGGAGITMLAGAKRRIGNWWLGGFVGAGSITNAAFVHSPLVETHTNWYTGVSLIWVFDKSDTTVSVNADDAI